MADYIFDGYFSSLRDKPNTLEGYGIVNGSTGTWNDITNTPTSIAEYGITDAMTTSHVCNAITQDFVNRWNNAYNYTINPTIPLATTSKIGGIMLNGQSTQFLNGIGEWEEVSTSGSNSIITHNELSGLDYVGSGHTGFAPTIHTHDYVSATPTPVDNQVAVWASGTAIEGTTGFTYDGSTLSITGNIIATGEISAFTGSAPGSWWDSMPYATNSTVGGFILWDTQFTMTSGVLKIKDSVLIPASHTHVYADVTDFSTGVSTYETSHSTVVVDGDFTSEGLMRRGASSGIYTTVTDNSTDWNTAYSHSQIVTGNPHAIAVADIADFSTGVSTYETSHANIVKNNQINTYTAGMKQQFQSNTTNAGFGFGGFAGNPTTLVVGDMWFNTSTNRLMYRDSSVSREIVARTLDQTLTNKTIALGSNTVSGTKSQFDTAVTDGDIAYRTGTLANTYLTRWSASDTVTGDDKMTWDGSTLTITGDIVASGEISAYADSISGSLWDSIPVDDVTIKYDSGVISIKPAITGNAGKVLTVSAGSTALEWATASAPMTYPGAGIPISTGSAWTTSITNNSTNWNTAYSHSQDNSQAHSDYLINNGNDTTSGILTAGAFRTSGTSDYNLITRSGGSNAMYVQQIDATGSIASFRYGSGSAAVGTEVVNINYVGMNVMGKLTAIRDTASGYITELEQLNTSGYGLRLTTAGTSTASALLIMSGADTLFKVQQDGKVGIGVAPSYALDVACGTDNVGIRTVSTDAYNNVYVTDSGGTAAFGVSSGSLTLGSDSSRYVTILSSGEVGIGITSPSSKLDVLGDIGIGYSGWQTGNIAVHYSSPDEGIIYTAKGHTGGWYGVHDFYTTYSGGSPVLGMRIKNGKVGIGTTTPTQNLSVQGLMDFQNAGTLRVLAGYNSGTAYGNYFGIDTLNGLKFGFVSAENTLVLKPTGYVGIGTTEPASLLDLRGSFKIQTTDYNYTTSTGSTISINLGATTGNTIGKIQIYNTGFHSYGNLVLQSSGGYVGIGTIAPTYKLEITSDTNGIATNLMQRWSLATQQSAYNLSLTQEVTAGLAKYIFSVNNVATLYDNNLVLDRGNVGVGTDAPAYQTEFVGGTGAAETILTQLRSNSTSTGTATALRFINSTSSTSKAGAAEIAVTRTNSPNYATTISFRNNQGSSTVLQEALFIDEDGNVGIGNTGPVAPLSVTGAITATGEITAYYSDIRLKTDIEPIKNAVDKVTKLTGFTYTPNKLSVELTDSKDTTRKTGVSAQSLQEILPEAVKIAPFDLDTNGGSKSGKNYLTVQYEKIVPLLIEAIKELKQEIEDLKNG